jgi:hypothetical protein
LEAAVQAALLLLCPVARFGSPQTAFGEPHRGAVGTTARFGWPG